MPLQSEEFPAPEKRRNLYALIVSGDGPLPFFARGLARAFVRRGVAASVIPSARYFWKRRTPEEFAHHLEARLETQLRKHGGDRFVLVGYSFGGAALPFAVRLLPAELRQAIALVVLAAPASRADFEFKLISWLNISGKDALDVGAELDQLITEGTPTLLVYGAKDLRRAQPSAKDADVLELPGGHDLGKDYERIIREIVARVGA